MRRQHRLGLVPLLGAMTFLLSAATVSPPGEVTITLYPPGQVPQVTPVSLTLQLVLSPVPDNSPQGTLVANATVTMSDGTIVNSANYGQTPYAVRLTSSDTTHFPTSQDLGLGGFTVRTGPGDYCPIDDFCDGTYTATITANYP